LPDASNPDGVGDSAATPGTLLRAARLERGLSVQQCADRLRARTRQIEAIERDDFAPLGGDVYARGFLRSYADIVGVDPQEVLRLHGHDPGVAFNPLSRTNLPLEMRRQAPAWLLTLIGLVTVGAVVAVVLMLGGQRTPSAVDPLDVPTVAPPSTAPPPTTVAPPVTEPVPQPAAPPVVVVMTVEATSWLEVAVDGLPVEPGRLAQTGETLRYTAQTEINVRYGNAGGVRVELNGVDLGPQGDRGQVVRVLYTPEGRSG
jgi:cytoskeleton protein RodZ